MNLEKLTLGELVTVYHLATIDAIAITGKEVLDEIARRARDARQVSALRDFRTYLGLYGDHSGEK